MPIYGFDSFEGLPDAWIPGFPKGYFDMKGSLPPVAPNVQLIKGWFDETLPLPLETLITPGLLLQYLQGLQPRCDRQGKEPRPAASRAGHRERGTPASGRSPS